MLTLALLAACDAAPQGSLSVHRADGSDPAEVTELDFGEVQMGTQARLGLVLSNTGAGPLTLVTLARSGDEAFGAALLSSPLAPSALRAFAVSFTPPLEPDASVRRQPFTGQLSLRSTTLSGAQPGRVVRLVGVGVRSACPQLSQVLDFGALAAGEPSPTLSVTLPNPGPGPETGWLGPITGSGFSYAPGTESGPVALPPGEAKALAFSFQPGEDGEARAFVEVRTSAQCPLQRLTLVGSSTSRPVTFEPSLLDFGDVPVGFLVRRAAVARNHTTHPVTLTGLRISASAYAATPMLLALPAATVSTDALGARTVTPGEAALTVSFRPPVAGSQPGTLSATAPFDVQSTAMLQLRGDGGGRDIEVSPTSLAMGRVGFFGSVGAQVTRTLTIANVGARAQPPDAARNLKLGDGGRLWSVTAKSANTSADELCVGDFAQGPCSNALAPQRYDATVGLEGGARLEVPVTVVPRSVGAKEWEVTVFSNDLDEPAVTVTVTANAVPTAPCDVTAPSLLSFGALSPPQPKDLRLWVENMGPQPCLVSSLALAPGSAPNFSLPQGPVLDEVIAPGQALGLLVRAKGLGPWPSALSTVTGSVQLQVAHPSPALSQRSVGLAATTGPSCLSVAGAHDFGTVALGCASRSRTFTVYNRCATPVTLDAALMRRGAAEFEVRGFHAGALPAAAAAPSTFTVRYQPLDLGSDEGVLVLTSTESGTKVETVVALAGEGDVEGLNTQTLTVPRKADILWVVESGSTTVFPQTQVSANAQSFFQPLMSRGLDFQLGVTEADPVSALPAGRLVTRLGAPKVLTPTTPNLTAAFKALIEVGGNGAGTESVLLPALWALTAPRITDENAGFVRDDASLAVIGFTSAPDQALRPAGYFIDALLNLKGPQLFSLAILGPTQPAAPSGCPGGYDDWSGSDALVEAVVEGTRGLRTEYCTTNWPATLDLLGNAAASPLRTLYLRAPRDVAKPMQVKLNGVVLPAFDARGTLWTYDPLTSALELQPLYAPGVGDTVSVTFSAQCL